MRRSTMLLTSLVITPICLADPAGAAGFVFSTFKGDRAPGERLSVYASTDALNFSLVSDTGFVGSSGTLRDPSIMKYSDGKYYVAHTNPPTESCCGREDHFSIATSSDLVNWAEHTTVAARVPGVAHTWAPEWFIDDGVVHIIASIDTLNNDTDFKPYLFTATNADLTEWSAPVPLGFGPNYIDTFVVKSAGVYHAFTKQETTRFLEHATAPTLTGPWTFIGVGNWSGFGSGMEGPNLVRLDDGTWRMFLDGQGNVGFLYAESTDLVTWSRAQPLPALSDLVRHGTIIRDAVDDSLVGPPPAAPDPGLPNPGLPGPDLPDAAIRDNDSSDAGRGVSSPVEPTPRLPSGAGTRGDTSSAPSSEATSGVTPAGDVSPGAPRGAGGSMSSGVASDTALPAAAGRSTDGGCNLAAPSSPSNAWGWAGLACVVGMLRRRGSRDRTTPKLGVP